jgi:hypothetical protein
VELKDVVSGKKARTEVHMKDGVPSTVFFSFTSRTSMCNKHTLLRVTRVCKPTETILFTSCESSSYGFGLFSGHGLSVAGSLKQLGFRG